MSWSFEDFVSDVKVMLQRTPPATDKEIVRWLNANDVNSHAEEILKTAKEELAK